MRFSRLNLSFRQNTRQAHRQAEHRRKERVILHADDALNLAQAVAHRVRMLKQHFRGGGNLHVFLHVDQRRLFQIGVVLRVIFADVNPDTLSQALPPALALGGVSPQEILRRFCPQGHPMSLPAQTALDHIFSPLYDLPEALRLPYYTLKVQELLLYLSQQAPAGERASNQYLSQQVEIIRAIHDQLMAHPNQRTTIEALAKEYHLNTSTLKAVFKAVYGQPIASHMKHHRMQEAARLLRETDLSIGDIAQQVGYENQSKFSNVFRDIFQVLPTEYRRQQSRDSKTEGRL